MKRRPYFLVAFVAAALTFGSLMAFVGPQRSGWNRDQYGWYGGWRHHHHYDDYYNRHDRYERRSPADSSEAF